ncbi:MAG TPA: class I SAM-dependent methyltransferase [Actinomycetes bacterium]|nr:class I SAM-dependent methyltransferase [Actinomycetes bacterium]
MNLAEMTALVERYGALQHPMEVLHLIEFLETKDPKLFIEVGVWRGGNAAILKTCFPDARIIGVDLLTPDAPEISDHPSLRDAIDTFGIELVSGPTDVTFPIVVDMIGDQKADYLFIDAAHDYDSVKRDFETWSPLARYVGFHDVHNPDVLRYWLELCQFMGAHARTAALWKEMDGHGIGVTQT